MSIVILRMKMRNQNSNPTPTDPTNQEQQQKEQQAAPGEFGSSVMADGRPRRRKTFCTRIMIKRASFITAAQATLTAGRTVWSTYDCVDTEKGR